MKSKLNKSVGGKLIDLLIDKGYATMNGIAFIFQDKTYILVVITILLSNIFLYLDTIHQLDLRYNTLTRCINILFFFKVDSCYV